MSIPKPYDPNLKSTLVDKYELTMAYVYWTQQKHNDKAVFELTYRTPPFGGEYLIFAGLQDALSFVAHFKFEPNDIDYIKTIMPPETDPEFYNYLASIDTSNITIESMDEGCVAFPRIPMINIIGPLAVCQLLETSLLNIINYACLVTTNAVRQWMLVQDKNINLYEFGTRRAQGTSSAIRASKYAYIGGFSATANVEAGRLFGIPVIGTMAHSYITSFSDNMDSIKNTQLKINGKVIHPDFVSVVKDMIGNVKRLIQSNDTNCGELTAMTTYAMTYPFNFTALIDTYSSLNSGILNFIIVSLSLLYVLKDSDMYHKALSSLGIRLDSGDLAHQSYVIRQLLEKVESTFEIENYSKISIIVSSDICEKVIESLLTQENSIDAFAIGTSIVTCQSQPSLGGVYKLAQIDNVPTMKFSENLIKISIPGKKKCYRLYTSDNVPVVDVMTREDEKTIDGSKPVLCRDPFNEHRMVKVHSSRVEPLHKVYFQDGQLKQPWYTIDEIKTKIKTDIKTIRTDHLRFLHPTPYKVSVSETLYNLLHTMWITQIPVPTLE